MREVKKATSHGGFSIRSIFIFAVTTIMVAFLSFAPLNNNAGAIVTPITDEVQNLQTSQNLNNSNTNTTNNKDNVITSGGSAITTEETAETKPKTSCAIDGIGWLICPVTKALAGGMDYVYDALSAFLTVQPIGNDQNSAIFRAWSYMRSFANIAFVIAFLIIIYSQMTNLGMNNYGIKKLLPRLIVAAILVNVSYYICSAAVDLSNVLGHSMQDVFMAIREKLLTSNTNSTSVPTWSEVTTLILAGEGALVGTYVTVSLIGAAGLATFLFPAALTAFLAVIVAFVIMAARQALVTILIILSPLAFVAYLLPNTEQWFKKWKSTLMTMLLLFPIFSIIFGGSQLASLAIIQNAKSMMVVILGLLVQVAPLLVTPLLMKFSGSLLGKIGGMVNNPSKGLIDRSKNWGKDIRDINRNRSLLRNENGPDRNLARAVYRRYDQRRFNRENDKKSGATAVDSRRIREYTNRNINSQSHFEREAMHQNIANESARSKAILEESYENLKAGSISSRYERTPALSEIARRSELATRDIAISSMANQAAKRIQNNSLADALKHNEDLRIAAGGIDVQNGAQRAMAASAVIVSKARAEILANANTIIDSVNPSTQNLTNLACGISIDGLEATADVQEAAIARIAASANAKAIIDVSKKLDFSPTGNEDFRVAFASNLPKSALRPAFLGYKLMDQMSQGIEGWNFEESVKEQIIETVDGEKLSADMIVGQAIDTLKEMAKTMDSADLGRFQQSGLIKLREEILDAYANKDLRAKIGEKGKHLETMLQAIENAVGPRQTPPTQNP